MSFTWGCAFPQNIFKNLTGKHFKFSEFLRNFAKNFAIFKNPFFTEHLRTPAAVSCKDCRIYAEIKHFLSYHFFLSKCHIRVAVFLWQSRNFQKQPPEVICRPQPLTLLKEALWHRCFLVNFMHFSRTNFFTGHLQSTAC